MANPTNNYYLGIDLGTTNTVISWVRVDPINNRIEPASIEINQFIENRGKKNLDYLPSFVSFEEGNPLVGEYSKSLLKNKPNIVVKSIKSLMGTQNKKQLDKLSFNNKIYTPSEISSIILKKVKEAIKKRFRQDIKDVIITVPASFDGLSRYATIQAAELAGFKTKNDDGSKINFLLDEPKAVLYAFLNQQERGLIAIEILDLSESKNILVFDLGGGTLDISLHKVIKSGIEIDIDDISISRYTLLGGDNFDDLLVNALLDRSFKKGIIDNTIYDNEIDLKYIKSALAEFAEQFKKDINYEIEQTNKTNLNDIKVEIIPGNILNYSFEVESFTYKEYLEIIEPLMGNNFTLDDIDNFDKIEEQDSENIIYPVLDVLYKAKKKLGQTPNVDAVLLNGGMCKFYPIINRIKEFFGVDPIVITDPDKSVAYGAAIYNYKLSKGLIKEKTTLAESIGIEIEGNEVIKIANAGINIPLIETNISRPKFIIPDGANFINIPIYKGEGHTIKYPNRKLAEGIFRFNNPQKEDTEIGMSIEIPMDKTYIIRAWLKNTPNKKYEMKVDPYNKNSEQISNQNSSNKTTQKETSQESIDIPSTITILERLLKKRKETRNPDKQNRILSEEIIPIESKILNAVNSKESYISIINLINRVDDLGKQRLIILLGKLTKRHKKELTNGEIDKFSSICISKLTYTYTHSPQYINTVMRYAVEALGRIGNSKYEDFLLKLLDNNYLLSIRESIIISIGKIEGGKQSVKKLKSIIKEGKKSEIISALWSLGRIGSRDRKDPINIRIFENVIKTLIKLVTNIYKEDNISYIRNLIYAVGEIGNRTKTENVIDENQKKLMLNSLLPFTKDNEILKIETIKNEIETIKYTKNSENTYTLGEKISEHKNLLIESDPILKQKIHTIKSIAEVSYKLINGEKLNIIEERTLLTIRNLMKTSNEDDFEQKKVLWNELPLYVKKEICELKFTFNNINMNIQSFINHALIERDGEELRKNAKTLFNHKIQTADNITLFDIFSNTLGVDSLNELLSQLENNIYLKNKIKCTSSKTHPDDFCRKSIFCLINYNYNNLYECLINKTGIKDQNIIIKISAEFESYIRKYESQIALIEWEKFTKIIDTFILNSKEYGKTNEYELQVSIDKEKENMIFSYKDYGEGMSSNHWERFPNTRNNRGGNTGIRLLIEFLKNQTNNGNFHIKVKTKLDNKPRYIGEITFSSLEEITDNKKEKEVQEDCNYGFCLNFKIPILIPDK